MAVADFSGVLGGRKGRKRPEQEKDAEKIPVKQAQREEPGKKTAPPTNDFARQSPEPQKIVFDEEQRKAREFVKKVAELSRETGFDLSRVEETLGEGEKGFSGMKSFAGKKSELKRTASGIEGLDGLIEGGFEEGSAVLLVGSAGTGKTIFGLQFLYNGAKNLGEPGIFVSFEEGRDSLFRHCSSFDFDLEGMESRGLLKILEYKPHEVEKFIEAGGSQIRDTIKEMKAKRLVIDSITAYGLLFKDEYQKREQLLELFEDLRKWGCTSLIVSELPPAVAEVKEGSVGFLTDAIISLYYAKQHDTGERVHSLEILKMRGTRHTDKLLAVRFEKSGIVVHSDVEVF